MYVGDLIVCLQVSLVRQKLLDGLAARPWNRVRDDQVQEVFRKVDVILTFTRLCTLMSYVMQNRVYLQDCAIPSINSSLH